MSDTTEYGFDDVQGEVELASGHKRLGAIKQLPDHRDYLYGAPSPVLAMAFADKIDLRSEMPRVYDQGNLGSCTANATNAIVQHCEHKAKDPDWDRLSRLWTYYYTRLLEGTGAVDAGATLRNTLKTTATKGVPREVYWKYDISKFAQEPTAGAVSAREHKVLEYRAIPEGSELSMLACLNEGYPFVYGFTVYDSFWDIGDDGWWDGTPGYVEGGHAVDVVGYDFTGTDFPPHWLVRNSWSTSWGDRGHFRVPRAYLPREAWDMWTVRLVKR